MNQTHTPKRRRKLGVLPIVASHDAKHLRFRYAVFASQDSRAHPAHGVPIPHVADPCGVKLGSTDALAHHADPAPFSVHVAGVVPSRAKPKVRGVDACGVVSPGAVVQHAKAHGDRPIGNHPRDAVGEFGPAAPATDTELPVTAGIRACEPKPTIVRASPITLFPEPCTIAMGKLGGHLGLLTGSCAGERTTHPLPLFYLKNPKHNQTRSTQ